MPNYTVQQGDTIVKIAKAHGFRRWETIWEDSANAALRKKRANPRVLEPGDVLVIPEIEQKVESCATENHHVFEVPVLNEMLRIQVHEARDSPMARKEYVLVVDGKEYEGTTGDDGLIEQAIPAESSTGELRIDGSVWTLDIGHLNPVERDVSDGRVSGAQARLRNLGFYDGDINGELDDATREAVRNFQASAGLEESRQTGDLDDQTCMLLEDRHGC